MKDPKSPAYLDSWKQTLVICAVVVVSNFGAAVLVQQTKRPQAPSASGKALSASAKPLAAPTKEKAKRQPKAEVRSRAVKQLRPWPPPEEKGGPYQEEWEYGLNEQAFHDELRALGLQHGLGADDVPPPPSILSVLIRQDLLEPFESLSRVESAADFEALDDQAQDLLQGLIAAYVLRSAQTEEGAEDEGQRRMPRGGGKGRRGR